MLNRPDPTEADTERAFLDAAERLFAERGFEGAKVRAIAEAAGANLGALHYYWGSKEELFRAVWRRRLDSLQEGRKRKFEECKRKAAEGPISIEEVLTIMVEAGLGVADWHEPRSEYFQQLYGRAISDPSPTVRNVVNQYFDDRASSFVELMKLACPNLSGPDLYWGLQAVFGAILHVHVGGEGIRRVVPVPDDEDNLSDGARRIVRFLAAGFKALERG